jgi:uncharacterized protein YndB with AHSA1/START domain
LKKTDQPIIVEQIFQTSAHILWSAITELDQMKQWFFENIESFSAVEGFETEFAVSNENRVFTHLWKIITVVPAKRITYNWKYREYEGDSLVTFEIIKENEIVKLKLTTMVTEDFPDTIPEFKRESCIQGWNYFICGRLKEYISLIS